MTEQIEKLIGKIVEDYNKDYSETEENLKKFRSEISYTEGKKYIKIISRSSVWGFIAKEDDKKFKKGDILKAAGWNTPAKNKARGNIFEDYEIHWTGPKYLK